jgi:2-oxoisovalerate dehydrogenase E2 component (dihydrolipoyl transacylase)
MSFEIIMPEMGEGVIEGTVGTWLVQVGEEVEEYEPVLEIETDKVTTEVVAEASGILTAILVQEGETVQVGQVLGTIGEEASDQPVSQSPIEEATRSASQPSASQPVSQSASSPQPVRAANQNGAREEAEVRSYPRRLNGTRVSPVVARMVAEHGIDIAQIDGSGRGGRVTKKDIEAFLTEQAVVPQRTGLALSDQPVNQPVSRETSKVVTASQPANQETTKVVSTSQPAPAQGDELVKLTGMRRAIADHMVLSKRTSPHVSTFFEFDYTAVAAHRAAHKAEFAQQGIKLTYMPYLVMAVAEALGKHPMANSTWTDEGILLKKAINVGMATAVPTGLLVPVIEHADELNLRGLSRRINDLAERARNNKLQPSELQGGTFTITNHGASGSLMGTPIINQPQVGILGVGLIEKRVKVINDAIAIRPCAYVSFSFDHRILDGATADAFVMDIKARIENWQ